MDVAQWQERLEEAFSTMDIIGARLLPIIEMEKECGRHAVKTFHGHNVLMDSFADFYIDTLEIVGEVSGRDVGHDTYRYYPFTVLQYVVMFRRLRAATILFTKGYPLAGYALLRDLKDSALFMAGLADGATSWGALMGVKGKRADGSLPSEEQYEISRKAGELEERRVLELMTGSTSGLPDAHLAELKRWTKLFHREVHGSNLTRAAEFNGWLRGQSPLTIGPTFNETSFAMYMNRVGEIGWMLLRVLPFLQLEPGAFGAEWARKWGILDESFRFYVESLDRLGKPIGRALAALVDVKFAFSPDTAYSERT